MEHWSDCAVHNEPAYMAGPCDCGGITLRSRLRASLYHHAYNLAEELGLLRLAVVRRAFRLEETSSSRRAHYLRSHPEPAKPV